MKWWIFILGVTWAMLAQGATNFWYVDCTATNGANNGTNWANAWTQIQSCVEDTSGIAPGDVVYISGGTYTNTTGFYLEHGNAAAWVTYRASQEVGHNTEVILKCQLSVKGYTQIVGARTNNYETNIGNNTYSVPLVTNNCNLFIDKSNDPATNQIALSVWSGPVLLQWLHVRGAGQSFDPGGMVVYYAGGDTLDSTNYLEIAYCWSDLSTGHGHLGLGGALPGIYDATKVHHCLFENHWADFCQWASGANLHHCVIRRRADLTWRGGCNDTFQVGSIDLGYYRIYNNVLEPLDNTVLYPGSITLSNAYVYNNVWHPVPPAYLPTNQVDHQGKDNVQFLNMADMNPALTNRYHYLSGVYYLNNTIDMKTNGADSLMVYYNRDMFDNGGTNDSLPMISVDAGMVIQNNLLLHHSIGGAFAAPLNLQGNADPVNDTYVGWQYGPSNMVVDYNVFWSTFHDACLTWSSNTTRTLLSNATQIAAMTGYSNNVSDMQVYLQDEANYNYTPVNGALTRGTNLTSLTNLMPDLDTDIYGNKRPASGAWTVGAVEYTPPTNGLLLWLTFAQDDGWTTNHLVTDRSGWTNNGIYFGSTNHETWPSWTDGPNSNVLNGAQFTINWTNDDQPRGTYIGITNLVGLKVITNATWAVWVSVDTNALISGYGGAFLSAGLESNTWTFGTYSTNGPSFWRPTGWDGMDPHATYAKWPEWTNTTWQHYALTWDGTNWTPYWNGTNWPNSLVWTNEHSPLFTNQWTGQLYSTNTIGGVYNWIGIGVYTHSGTPDPDDADDMPNNGQLWAKMADLRIYNRALSASEVAALYAPEPPEPPATTNVAGTMRVSGTLRVGRIGPP